MTDEHELEVDEDGNIRGIYSDTMNTFLEELEGKTSIRRLSHVEWEEEGTNKGWTVRLAKEPDFAIRWENTVGDMFLTCTTRFPENSVVYFKTRKEALEAELKFVWHLVMLTGD